MRGQSWSGVRELGGQARLDLLGEQLEVASRQVAGEAAERFGPSVDLWCTINEPNIQIINGYVGDRIGLFSGPPGLRQRYPSYTQGDLHTGVRGDAWTVTLFVTNVADQRGVLGER